MAFIELPDDILLDEEEIQQPKLSSGYGIKTPPLGYATPAPSKPLESPIGPFVAPIAPKPIDPREQAFIRQAGVEKYKEEMQGLEQPLLDPTLIAAQAITGGVLAPAGAALSTAGRSAISQTATQLLAAGVEDATGSKVAGSLAPIAIMALELGAGIAAQKGWEAYKGHFAKSMAEKARAAGYDIPEEELKNFAEQWADTSADGSKLRAATDLRKLSKVPMVPTADTSALVPKSLPSLQAPNISAPSVPPLSVPALPSLSSPSPEVPAVNAPSFMELPDDIQLDSSPVIAPEVSMPPTTPQVPAPPAQDVMPKTYSELPADAALDEVPMDFTLSPLEEHELGLITSKTPLEREFHVRKIQELKGVKDLRGLSSRSSETQEAINTAAKMTAEYSEAEDAVNKVLATKTFPSQTIQDKFGGEIAVPETIPGRQTIPSISRPSEIPTIAPSELEPKTQFGELAETLSAREVKPIVRHLTGQVKISDLTDERTALKAVMEAQQRSSKLGFRVGKAEGVEATKEHYQTLQENQVIREELKTRIDSAINTIKSLPTENLPLDYKDRLEGMKAGIDPANRSNKTLEARAKMRSFVNRQIEAGEEINIPKETLDLINKKSISEMTIDEAENLANAMQQIAHLGKLKGKLIRIQEGRELDSMLNELSTTITKGRGIQPPIPRGYVVSEGSKKEFLPSKIETETKAFLDKNMRQERVLSKLDNYQGEILGEEPGPNTKYIMRPIEDASNAELIGKETGEKNIIDAMKKYSIDHLDLVRTKVFINKHVRELTGEEMVEVYLADKDPEKRFYLQNENGFNNQDIEDTLSAMPDNIKGFSQWIIDGYYGSQFPEINRVHKSLTNTNLGQTENYSPIVFDRDVTEFKSFEEDLEAELLLRQKARVPQLKKTFTIVRKGGGGALSLKSLDNLSRYNERVEHYKAFGETARDLRKIVNNPKYRDAVISREGKSTYAELQKWMNDIISEQPSVETPLGKYARWLRLHSTVAQLGFNMMSLLKTPVSISSAAALAGEKPILSGILQLATKYKETLDFVYAKSPQTKYSNAERDIIEVAKQARGGLKFNRNSLSEKSLKWMNEVDRAARVASWKGSYDAALAELSKKFPYEKADKEAVSYANKIVNRSQHASEMKDLPAFFRGGEIERWITAFTNERNQASNIFIHDIMGELKAKKISKSEALRRLVWVWLIPSVAMGAISRGRLPESKEEMGKDALMYNPITGGLFLIGNLTEAMIQKYDYSPPAAQGLKELGTAIKAKKSEKILEHGAKATGYLLGIPGTSQGFRTGKGAVDLASGKTKDLRRLIYSEQALKKEKAKEKIERERVKY